MTKWLRAKLNLRSFCYFVTVSHENFITFNCNYVYIKYFNHRFNFCVSKSFYYSADDALLRKAFTDILNCRDIHFTYILTQEMCHMIYAFFKSSLGKV